MNSKTNFVALSLILLSAFAFRVVECDQSDRNSTEDDRPVPERRQLIGAR